MKFHKIGTKFYVTFIFVVLLPATYIAKYLQSVILGIKWEFIRNYAEQGVIETPTAIVIISLFIWAYENVLWRFWPFRFIHRIPYLGGRYKGEVESSFNDGAKFPIVLEICQSLTAISICVYTERSSSFSINTNIGKNDNGNDCLMYIYKNTPRTVAKDLDMRSHDGVACLEIFEDGKRLLGYYYNDPRERGRHGSLTCLWTSDKIKGHF